MLLLLHGLVRRRIALPFAPPEIFVSRPLLPGTPFILNSSLARNVLMVVRRRSCYPSNPGCLLDPGDLPHDCRALHAHAAAHFMPPQRPRPIGVALTSVEVDWNLQALMVHGSMVFRVWWADDEALCVPFVGNGLVICFRTAVSKSFAVYKFASRNRRSATRRWARSTQSSEDSSCSTNPPQRRNNRLLSPKSAPGTGKRWANAEALSHFRRIEAKADWW